MSTAGLGVVVPVHGEVDPVLPLLRSVVEDPAVRRVVVVDDASPCRWDEDAMPPGVHLLRREVNGGFGAAVNSGLAALAAEPGIGHALVLNSDLTIPAGFARALLEHTAPWMPAVAGCRILGLDGGSAYSARRFPTIGHQVVEWLVPLASHRHRDLLHRAVGHDVRADRSHGVLPVDWVSGAVLLLPLPEVLGVGGFDEGYFMYTEEVDLQLRLRRREIPSVLDADLRAVHTGGGSAGGESRRRQWLVGARMRYARKHGHVHLLRTCLVAASVVNLVWNTGRRVTGRDVRPLAVAAEEFDLVLRAGRELPA